MPNLRWAFTLLALVGLAESVRAQAASDRTVRLATGDLWIKGVTVISPERPAPLRGAHVVVRGPRIISVGTREPQGDTTGVRVLDGAGRFLVPGLMDSHVHLGGVPGMTDEHEKSLPDLVKAYYRQLPRSYLYFGFTTVVDLNALDPAILDSLRRADWTPRIIDCGGGLPLANGYPMVYASRAARFDLYRNFLYDDRQADSIPAKYLASEHTPEAAVARVKQGGASCVKTYYELGFDPTMGKLPVPTLSMLRRVVSASHGMGLPVLIHANSLVAHRVAIDVPVDAMAHGLWNYDEAGPSRDGIPDSVRVVLDREIRQGIAYLPTLRVLQGIRDMYDSTFLDDSHVAAALPADLIAWYRTEPAQFFKHSIARGQADSVMLAMFRSRERSFTAPTAYIAAHGGRIVLGSDTPSSPGFSNPPGLNGYLELQAMGRVGMSPRQILQAATVAGARLLKVDRELGSIAPGKSADLLLLRDDPLRSVDAYDSIDIVVVRGRAVRRAELRADRLPERSR